jgi:hypothetical protein
MVYSSSIWSRSPRHGSFEVTAAQLACDVHRIRVAAVGRVAADVWLHVERLT